MENKREVKINSHKQLNNAIMKRFCDKGKATNSVYVFDIKNNVISYERTKVVGTELNFFSRETEGYLSNWENNFIGFLRSVDEWVAKGESFDLERYEPLFKNFLTLITIRSQKMMERIKESNQTMEGLGYKYPDAFKNGFSNEAIVNMFKSIMGGKGDKLTEFEKQFLHVFEDFTMGIVKNQTDIDFVTAKCGLYSAKYRSGKKRERIFVFPIDSKKAVVLVDKNNKDYFRNKSGKIKSVAITDPKTIKNYNYRCFKEEMSQDGEVIIAKDAKELEIIKRRNNVWNKKQDAKSVVKKTGAVVRKVSKVIKQASSKNEMVMFKKNEVLRESAIFKLASDSNKEIEKAIAHKKEKVKKLTKKEKAEIVRKKSEQLEKEIEARENNLKKRNALVLQIIERNKKPRNKESKLKDNTKAYTNKNLYKKAIKNKTIKHINSRDPNEHIDDYLASLAKSFDPNYKKPNQTNYVNTQMDNANNQDRQQS